MANKKRVAVIFGGQSSEHEVSRVSATSIINNIDKEKFELVIIGITKDGRWLKYEGPTEQIASGEWEKNALEHQLNINQQDLKNGVSARFIFELLAAETQHKKIDVVFPALHGINGEDGTIQGLFELAGIPYVGCGVLAGSVGMDKVFSKIIFGDIGIPQGEYKFFTRKEINENIENVVKAVETKFKYPCFVKPSNAGSSVGVSKARNKQELINSLLNASKYDRKVLVEEFINGREIECAVLGNDTPMASMLGEIVPGNEFYDYNAKYVNNESKTLVPADLDESTAQKIKDYAVKAFKALDCSGLSRVDFFVDRETGNIYINEINTLPGFTSISMYPKLWEATGIKYEQLIERLIYLAIERFEDNKKQLN